MRTTENKLWVFDCNRWVVKVCWGGSTGAKYPSTALLCTHKTVQEQPQSPGQSPANWGCGCSLWLGHKQLWCAAIKPCSFRSRRVWLQEELQMTSASKNRNPSLPAILRLPGLASPEGWCRARLSAGRNEHGSMGLCQFSPAMDLAKQAPPPLSACSLAQGSPTSTKSPIQMVLLMCKFLIQRKDKCW